jgi:hypothetical protein
MPIFIVQLAEIRTLAALIDAKTSATASRQTRRT